MSVGKKIIMGIDPGTNKMGYGVIAITGRKVECVVMGYIELSKLEGPYRKLAHIFERVSSLMEQYNPEEVAFEAPFFGDNVQSMLKLGRAQGVAMAAALHKGKEVFEYAPTKIKIAIAGDGRASKEGVARMLQKILQLESLPKNLDSTDGLAVALCHYYSSMSPLFGKSVSSWEEYVKKNPQKINK